MDSKRSVQKKIHTYQWKKWLWLYWITFERKDEGALYADNSPLVTLYPESGIEFAGIAFTREGAFKKICKYLDIAYKGPDSDGK